MTQQQIKSILLMCFLGLLLIYGEMILVLRSFLPSIEEVWNSTGHGDFLVFNFFLAILGGSIVACNFYKKLLGKRILIGMGFLAILSGVYNEYITFDPANPIKTVLSLYVFAMLLYAVILFCLRAVNIPPER